MAKGSANLSASRLSIQPSGFESAGACTVIKAKKLDRLIDHLNQLNGDQFTGYIKINFSQGNVGRIEKFEEILKS